MVAEAVVTASQVHLAAAPDRPTHGRAETLDTDSERLLLRLRQRASKVVEIAGNRPILLDDPAAVWVIASSHVEVFAVRVQDGRPVGARRHLLRAERGDALFGMDLRGQSVGLLASGASGGELLCVERASLAHQADRPESARAVAGLVERWTALVSSSLALDQLPHEQPGTWDRLDRFHARALTALAADEERRRHADRARHEARARTDRGQMRSAVTDLAQSLAPQSRQRRTMVGRNDPLFEACRLVGDALGVTLRSRAGAGSAGHEVPIQAIARTSRLRIRRVTLRGPWWKSAHGPFVGYRTEDGRPVALLPTSDGYELHDPVDGTVIAVTATVALSLTSAADTFYPRLGDHSLTAGALLMFGIRGSGGDLLRLLALSSAVGMLGLLVPVLIGVLFDLVIPGGHRLLLFQLGTWLAAGAVATALFQVSRDIAILRLSGRIQATLEPALVDRLLELPVSFFQHYLAGDLAGRVFAVSTIRETLTGQALSAFLSGLFGAFSLVLLFIYEPGLALVTAGLVVVFGAVLAASCYLQVRLQRKLGERTGRLAGTVLQLINGVSKLRVAGAESRAFTFWAERSTGQRQIAYQARSVANGLAVFIATYPLLASMVLFGVVALTGEPGPSVGTFLAFNAAFNQLMGSAISLAQASTAICQAAPAYERARPILLTRVEVEEEQVDPGELRGAIDMHRVSFRYSKDGPLVLDDVTIACRPGQLVALVGPSGSGKSTLLRLLLGFEAPEAGAIRYDGRDLASLDTRAVRRQIGTVLQSGRLLAGDIFTNIASASALTLEDAWHAARLAGLDEEIRQLPMGMHTVLGEGVGTLSGGQQQRLMIARALVHQPRLVFFDEATSALDNQTQETVAKSLERLAVTRLVIAHRLSTVVNADRIYVLDHGRIAESGTFGELMGRGGLFTALARRQIV